MAKDNKINYDETIHQAERLVKELEQADALSMDVYKQKSTEVKHLLDLCEKQLTEMEKELLF